MGTNTRLTKVAGIAATVMGLVASGIYVTGADDPGRRSADRASSPSDAVDRKAVAEEIGRMPLSFEPNVGQGADGTAFLARGLDYSLALAPTEATISAGPSALKMRLVGANPAANMVGREELEGRINYLVGDDPAGWHTDVATYSQVTSTGVWPGVDLLWHSGKAGELEYDFIVAPGTSPEAIAVGFEGAKGLRLEGGDLVVATEAGDLRQHAPVLYQDLEGRRKPVPGSFVLDNGTVRFAVGAYDTTQPLVIDPTLEYSTYLGGIYGTPADDRGNDIAVDATGAAYVAGIACTNTFPTTTYAYDRTNGGKCDAFVTKFNAVQGTGAGTGLKYSTYLGGRGRDEALQIAVDAAGNAYAGGTTTSGDFPTTAGAYDRTCCGGFVAKLNPKGRSLLYSTFTGGATGMALGPAMPATPTVPTVYVVHQGGGTNPTTSGAFQSGCTPDANGFNCADIWLGKINPVGAKAADLLYGTYLGGNGEERMPAGSGDGGGLAVDADGRAYVSATTKSTNFPMAGPNGSFDTTCGVDGTCRPSGTPGASLRSDRFVAMVDPSLTGDGSGIPSASNQQLLWSTYLGGDSGEVNTPIALGPGGTVYVAGSTGSADFPATAGAYDTTWECGGLNCITFMAKFDPTLPGDGSGAPSANNGQLVYSTFLGKGNDDTANDITVDPAGNAWIAGYTNASTFPTKNPVQAMCGCFIEGGRADGFVAKLSPAATGADDLLFSTFLGGKDIDALYGVAIGPAGSAYVAGISNSNKNSHGNGKADRYPVTPGAFQANNPGGATELCNGFGCYDAVVSKISGA